MIINTIEPNLFATFMKHYANQFKEIKLQIIDFSKLKVDSSYKLKKITLKPFAIFTILLIH